MKNGQYLLLSALSALLCAFALTDFNYGILPWFSLAPFLFALGRGKMARGALNGFIFGYVYGLVSFYWLPLTEGVSYFQFLLLIVPIFSSFYLLYGLFYSPILFVLGRWMIVVGPALWVSIEYARANFFFLALPWNFLSHSQVHFTTLIQTADI
ncbi:MAG: hypothetical protein JSW26_08430, partial [Desulfobacterales bacterium]